MQNIEAEKDLIEEVEALLAKATLKWANECPDDNGIYWFHQEGNPPELLLVQDGFVYDFGDNEPTSIGFYGDRGKFKGPVFASDAERLTNLLRRLVDENKRLKRGDFTDEEFQNLCHKTEVQAGFDAFADGCEAYQQKMFGRCRKGTTE